MNFSIGMAEKSKEQLPDNGLSEAMKNLSVAANNSNKNSSPNLCDMPLDDVVGLIIEKSDYKEQLVLRKVSKSLRSLVDQQKPACTNIHVSGDEHCIICTYNNHSVVYTSPEKAKYLKGCKGYPFSTTVSRTDFEEVAFDDLVSTLKNPKLQLETFSVFSEERDLEFEYLKYTLKSMNHQLSVKSFGIDISELSAALSILPYLKPGVLEKIKVMDDFGFDFYDGVMKEVSLLDQWKQAEEFEIEYGHLFFSMKYAAHFKRFHIIEPHIFSTTLVKMRDWLAIRENFEFCLIELREQYIDAFFARDYSAVVGQSAPPNNRTQFVSHYSIPDSDYYLEYLFFEKSIEMQKKKRSNSGF